ncbi:uncharacterized protein RCH25_008873 [Pelodytes ibericus]
MEPARSSLGLLSGYNSSSDDDAIEKSDGPSPSVVNFFANSASSSDEEAEVQKEKGADQDPVPVHSSLPRARLPAPLLGKQTGTGPGGVFSSTFREEKEAQLSVLEQHVKLSDTNWSRRGRGACLAYQRNGRCRFGTSCKYSHESDLPQTGIGLVHKQVESSLPRDDVGGMQTWPCAEGGEDRDKVRDGDEKEKEKKRKKPGLSNTLIPPKKTMKNYKEQVATERPWAL